jgi:N6-adenosine-specific RNA methylase IME4
VFDLIHFSLPIKYLQLFPDVPLLMEKGFIFVWVDHRETQIGYHLLNRWGFDIIDQIIWIKSNEEEGHI